MPLPKGGEPATEVVREGTPLPPPRLVIGSSMLSGLSISTGALRPAFSADTTRYAVTSLNAIFPVSVTATAVDDTATLTINGQPAESGVPFSLVLQPGEDLSVVVTGSWAEPREYSIAYSPPALPTWKVMSSATAGTEDLLLNAGSYLLMLNRLGQPLYYRSLAPNRAFDFQQHPLPNGDLEYSFNEIDINDPNHVIAHVMGRDFVDIATLVLLPHGDHDTHPCDSHDLLVLGPRHYLLMAYIRKVVDLSGLDSRWSSAAPVYAAVVQEIDHGQVVFEWDSTHHPSLYGDSVDSNAFTNGGISDYLHLNSIQVDPLDKNLILSFRHSDSVIKVDRRTGSILWTLGGRSDSFGLTHDQQFSHQHFARMLPDHTLVIFDNGNKVRQSRVVRFTLDETQHTVGSFEIIYDKPLSQPQTNFMGSATELEPDRFVIGWGGWEPGMVTPPSVTETIAGVPTWSLTFDAPSLFSYRALPITQR